jgi:hypothetical protein
MLHVALANGKYALENIEDTEAALGRGSRAWVIAVEEADCL